MRLPSTSACLACVLVSTTLAHADPLQLPRILGATLVTRTGEAVETVTFGTIDIANAAFGAAVLTMGGVPMPIIEASASGAANPVNTSVVRAVGQIEYVLSVIGDPGLVPVTVTVSGSARADTGFGATYALESSWSLTGEGVNVGDAIRTGQQTGSFSDGIGRTVDVLLVANRLYTVVMRADASVGVTTGATGGASATIDPTFVFGAGVDPAAYAFAFSPGIGNTRPDVGTVPEPASGVLVTAGALVVAAARRRAGNGRRADTRGSRHA